jgi:xanthine/CO dehydrogenase XdhC/CoxF family maturation factor
MTVHDAQTAEDALRTAAAWRDAGREVAMATVIATWGSSPRPVGSRLVVDDRGNMWGSVSGGCVEGAVVQAAREVIAGGAPRTVDYGISDETAWDVGLTCGGRLQVFIERLE